MGGDDDYIDVAWTPFELHCSNLQIYLRHQRKHAHQIAKYHLKMSFKNRHKRKSAADDNFRGSSFLHFVFNFWKTYLAFKAASLYALNRTQIAWKWRKMFFQFMLFFCCKWKKNFFWWRITENITAAPQKLLFCVNGKLYGTTPAVYEQKTKKNNE